MIFCCDFWERNQHPKFYDKTVSMMKGMDGRAFLSEENFDIFYHRLVKRLGMDRPEDHTAHLGRTAFDDSNMSQIYLVSGKGDTDIARLYVHRIKRIKTYGFENQATFDVFKIAEGGEV